MGRKRTRLSAFQVFMNKGTRSSDPDPSKSDDHRVKDQSIHKRKRKNKFEDLSELSLTSQRNTRTSSQGGSTKITEPEFVKSVCKKLTQRRLRKRGRVSNQSDSNFNPVVKNVSDEVMPKREKRNSCEGDNIVDKLPKQTKKQRHISSADIDTKVEFKMTLEGVDRGKKTKRKSIEAGTDVMHVDCLDVLKPVKRKHGDDSVEKVKAIAEKGERKAATKKNKSTGKTLTKSSSPDFTEVLVKGSTSQKSRSYSELQNDQFNVVIDNDDDHHHPQTGVVEDTVQMVAEVVEANLMEPSFVVQTEGKVKHNRKKEGKMWVKSKSTSDINQHVTKACSDLNISRSSLVSKWKTYSRSTDKTEVHCSSPSSPKSFEVDEEITKEESELTVKTAVTVKPDHSKHKNSKQRKVKESDIVLVNKVISKSKKENETVKKSKIKNAKETEEEMDQSPQISRSKKTNRAMLANKDVSKSKHQNDALSESLVDEDVSGLPCSDDHPNTTTVDEMETSSEDGGLTDCDGKKEADTSLLNSSWVSVDDDEVDVNQEDENATVDNADTSVSQRHNTHGKSRILAFKTDDSGVLLLLPHPRQICLQGRGQVRVIHGGATILQYKLTQSSPPCRVFSPSSHSLLTLETKSGVSLSELKTSLQHRSDKSVSSDKLASDDLTPSDKLTLDNLASSDKLTSDNFDNLAPHTLSSSNILAALDKIYPNSGELFVLLKIESICSPSLDYLCSFSPYTNLFSLNIGASRNCNRVLQSVRLAVDSPDKVDLSVLSVADDHQQAINKWVNLIKYSNTPPVVLVCAGKNCGKSTTARMLVNAALNVTDEVCFLECDVGQSELTPSGSISLHRLTQPLLGPPFTHQREAHSMCFFGGVTPSDDPSLYVTQLQYVYSYYRNLKTRVPLIVNTMGWVEGLGLCLLMDTIHLTCPTLIIQLHSQSTLNNFKPITHEYVLTEPGWLFSNKQISELNRPAHELIQLKSLSDNLQSVILNWKPVDHRNMSLLVYLSAHVKPHSSLHSLTPYAVTWSKVGVHVCHHAVRPAQVLCAINASVVALCHADLTQAHQLNEDSPWVFDKVPVCQCLGLGLVRGIDPGERKIYVVTPISQERLQNVNVILKGANAIPENILLQQKSFNFIPYVDTILMTQTAGKYRSRRIARR